MQIGQLAAATGLSRDTLRFYEREGLLTAHRRANGYRDYPAASVTWLRQLRLAQQLGFTLAELKAARPLLDATPAVLDAEVARQLARKLAEVDERLQQMQQLRAAIATRLTQRCPFQDAA